MTVYIHGDFICANIIHHSPGILFAQITSHPELSGHITDFSFDKFVSFSYRDNALFLNIPPEGKQYCVCFRKTGFEIGFITKQNNKYRVVNPNAKPLPDIPLSQITLTLSQPILALSYLIC